MITFYVNKKDHAIIKKIDRLAALWKRSRSYVIIQALKQFVQEMESDHAQ